MPSNPAATKFLPTQIAALKPRGKTYDVSDPAVPNLLVRVGPNGTKRWLFRYQWKKERTRISLGRFPRIGVAQARELAIANQNLIDRGIDPRQALRKGVVHKAEDGAELVRLATTPPDDAKAVTCEATVPEGDSLFIPKPDDPDDKHSFHFLAYEYVEYHVKPNRDHPAEVVRILKKDALPYWQKRDARTITSREIIERLDAIVARGAPVMANRTAQIFSQMFTLGIHRAIVESSPVNLLFPPGGAEKACNRVLDEDELHRFVHGLSEVVKTDVRRRTLMVLLLTAVRRGSLAQAEWAEFDFIRREWHIPAEHDKERRAHIVPLTAWATEELLALKRLSKAPFTCFRSGVKTRPIDPPVHSSFPVASPGFENSFR